MDCGKIIYIYFDFIRLISAIGVLWDHNIVIVFIAGGVNIISTILKIGGRNYMSAELMAASVVAELHLIPSFIYMQVLNNANVAVALALGALVANIVSIIFLAIESIKKYDDFN